MALYMKQASTRALPMSNAEWDARVQLAAAYRIFDHLGWTEMIFNHISLRVPGDERKRRAKEALERVQLGSRIDHRPNELSGGQRQRVAIGRAIIRRPALIIADEPVSALDMTIQKQILELLKSLQEAYDFACLFISHDLGAVEQVADRVLVMDAGKVVETGPRDDIFDRPRHDYTKRLLAASPSLSVSGSGFELHSRNRLAV